MKLHPFANQQINLFTHVEKDSVKVNQQLYQVSLIVTAEAVQENWTTRDFTTLTEADFEKLASLGAQIVLLGTGGRLRFPPPNLLRPIAEAGVGLEVMDIAAACRTFNILVAEGRSVAAALVFDLEEARSQKVLA